MLRRLMSLFNRYNNPYEKYKTQISEAKSLIRHYEQKYKMTSDEFITKRYSRCCTEVEAADANNWATLYLTIGKMVK